MVLPQRRSLRKGQFKAIQKLALIISTIFAILKLFEFGAFLASTADDTTDSIAIATDIDIDPTLTKTASKTSTVHRTSSTTLTSTRTSTSTHRTPNHILPSSPFKINCPERISQNKKQNHRNDNDNNGLWANTKNHTAPSFQMNIHALKEDVFVSKDILNHGCFECHLLNNFLHFVKYKASSDAFVLDIGGNLGLYALSVGALNREAYAFEPFKKNQDRFCSTLVLNKFDDLVTLFGVALSDQRTVLDLQTKQSPNNLGGVSIQQSTTKTHHMNKEKKEVKMMTTSSGEKYVDYTPVTKLDDEEILNYLPKDRPVVMKVDVEGSECDAIAGAFNYLSNLTIEYVEMEWSYERLTACKIRTKMFQLFEQKNGLKPWMVKKDKIIPLSTSKLEGWKNPGDHIGKGLYDIAWSKEPPCVHLSKYRCPVVV